MKFYACIKLFILLRRGIEKAFNNFPVLFQINVNLIELSGSFETIQVKKGAN